MPTTTERDPSNRTIYAIIGLLIALMLLGFGLGGRMGRLCPGRPDMGWRCHCWRGCSRSCPPRREIRRLARGRRRSE